MLAKRAFIPGRGKGMAEEAHRGFWGLSAFAMNKYPEAILPSESEGCFHHVLAPWAANIRNRHFVLTHCHPGSTWMLKISGHGDSFLNFCPLGQIALNYPTFLTTLWEQVSSPCHYQQIGLSVCSLPCAYHICHLVSEVKETTSPASLGSNRKHIALWPQRAGKEKTAV